MRQAKTVSILILGKDTGEGLDLLKRIQTHLDNLGFYTYIIKEQPDIIGESVMQKVLRFGLSSRFVNRLDTCMNFHTSQNLPS